MNKRKLLVVFLMLSGFATAQDLLIAWDSGGGTNCSYKAPGINGSLFMDKTVKGTPGAAQSTDGTYGSIFTGASTGTNWAVALGTNTVPGTNCMLGIRIVNKTGSEVVLDKIHFDVSGKDGAPQDFELRYSYGSLSNMVSGTVVASFSKPALSGFIGDYSDYDLPLTGMADNVLAKGQAATFTLVASNATKQWVWAWIDNIAISGRVISAPIILGVQTPETCVGLAAGR